MSVVKKVKLLSTRLESGDYRIYVFLNLDNTNLEDKYIMAVRFPNWEAPTININDVGYLEYKEVIAGSDKWWDKNTGDFNLYNYDNIIFLNFIHEEVSADLTVML